MARCSCGSVVSTLLVRVVNGACVGLDHLPLLEPMGYLCAWAFRRD